MFYKAHSSPFLRGALNDGLLFLEASTGSNASARDGGKSRPHETLCGHMASTRRRAGLLESLAGRQGLRILVHHATVGAIP
jgi:hypothetical protein